jgi:hypothetical protein
MTSRFSTDLSACFIQQRVQNIRQNYYSMKIAQAQ